MKPFDLLLIALAAIVGAFIGAAMVWGSVYYILGDSGLLGGMIAGAIAGAGLSFVGIMEAREAMQAI